MGKALKCIKTAMYTSGIIETENLTVLASIFGLIRVFSKAPLLMDLNKAKESGLNMLSKSTL